MTPHLRQSMQNKIHDRINQSYINKMQKKFSEIQQSKKVEPTVTALEEILNHKAMEIIDKNKRRAEIEVEIQTRPRKDKLSDYRHM